MGAGEPDGHLSCSRWRGHGAPELRVEDNQRPGVEGNCRSLPGEPRDKQLLETKIRNYCVYPCAAGSCACRNCTLLRGRSLLLRSGPRPYAVVTYMIGAMVIRPRSVILCSRCSCTTKQRLYWYLIAGLIWPSDKNRRFEKPGNLECRVSRAIFFRS